MYKLVFDVSLTSRLSFGRVINLSYCWHETDGGTPEGRVFLEDSPYSSSYCLSKESFGEEEISASPALLLVGEYAEAAYHFRDGPSREEENTLLSAPAGTPVQRTA